MSTISQNTIRTPRIHLRSATQRRNNPSALARRTRALETRRTNLGNTIIELESDLRQQRAALATLTIEVDQALRRRDDEGDRYERLRIERDNLRYTLLTNFNQSDLGMEYKELKRRWYEHVNNEDENTPDANYYDNFKARFDQVSALFDELMDTGLAPIIEQKALAREIYRQASEHHYSLYQQQQSLMRIVSDLERKLKRARIRDTQLNQARGKKQHKSKKKGKKHNS
jgi:polyhydroxyalkanoate synthesis regulator phasin